MPLRGTEHSHTVNDSHLYFTSLAELDAWADVPSQKRIGVLEYQSRCSDRDVTITVSKGSLLLCHDYKGGYSEKPSALSYIFNFWSYCDTFIYFSHHRVTIPPAGWITAAHRQGVKMLGTLIFEHQESEADCLRLLVGRLPQSTTGAARTSRTYLPVSPHYARTLAHLAYQKGFDGYLLNFEYPFQGKIEQTRALCAWIALLEGELKRLVGDHAQVIWYDSIILDGQLRWQDRLNSLNLPFFLPSSSFFTNYTWAPHYPPLTAQYFLSLDEAQLSKPRPKSLKDIYIGIDVWGRGQHGGGGLACYKALDHVDPEFLGLSVALFGPAWTWETREGQADFTWDKWWAHERTLWVGPEDPTETVQVPDPPEKQVRDKHGPFKPISAYFALQPPPNPEVLSFFTSFSPGVGRSWFVGGEKVLDTPSGWTDVDKNASIGNMLWPAPALAWEHIQREEPLPQATSLLDMEDAWLGGNSLRISFHVAASDAEDAFFRCIWVPIQLLTFSPNKEYNITLVYKAQEMPGVEFDVGLSVKVQSNAEQEIKISPVASRSCELAGGWTMRSVDACVPSDSPRSMSVVCGLVLGFAMEDPTQDVDFHLSLGSLTVWLPPPSASSSQAQPKILWADFQNDDTRSPSKFSGTLTWGRGEFFEPITGISVVDPDDPRPAWVPDVPCPSFLYFNIYVLPHSSTALDPTDAIFIGTTGLDGRLDRFFVDPACLPTTLQNVTACRFYVQGITDRGEILPWEHCVFVDVEA